MSQYVEQHELTDDEYERLQYLLASKRAVGEMLQTLHSQLSEVIYQEEVWWNEVSKKYQLDAETMSYTIDHDTQAILGANKPKPTNTPQQTAPRENPIPNVPKGAIIARPVVPYEDPNPIEENLSDTRQRKQNPPGEDFMQMEKLIKEYEAKKGLI